jgi:crossover junction endodeoxyribonuclease RusA
LPVFEFVVEGPAVSSRARMKSPRRYQKWIQTVRAAAQREWPPDRKPTASNLAVIITNYYTLAPPDIDNIIKPILDALNALVYHDDEQVFRVTSEKFDLSKGGRVTDPSPLLAGSLTRYREFIYVVVSWNE